MKLHLFFVFLLTLQVAHAQYVTLGTAPGRTTWSYIEGQHFNVIFPDSIRAQGEHFTRLLNRIYLPAAASMGHLPRRIPVILHPYNLQSNGMVVWVPSRMEIITAAPSDTYSQQWLELLALHEYRHVVQTDMMNCGFTRGLYYLLGEQAVALPSAIIRPWLFEGDAIATETAMSFAGRGRMPSFGMGMRTLALSEQNFSFSKYLFGSFKDFVPNHYEYGYPMAAYGRYRYGAELWGNVFRFTGNYPFLIYAQSAATKKYTGKNSRKFHHEAMHFLEEMWQAQSPQRADEPHFLLREKKHAVDRFVDYADPVFVHDSLIFAVRRQLSRTPQLVRIEQGQQGAAGQDKAREKRVTMPGSVSSRLTAAGSHIYWTEYRPDLRWEQRNYSELWHYDVEKNRTRRLTHEAAYFTPAVNEQHVLAVSNRLISGQQTVVLLDSSFGAARTVLHLPAGQSISDMVWVDNHTLAVLYTSLEGVSITALNVQSGARETLLPHTYAEVSGLSARGQHVFFSSGYSGINNIYAVNVQSKQVYRLTASAFGAFAPQQSADQSHLLYVDYTVRGGKPVSLPTDSLRWERTAFDRPYRFPLAETLAQQEQFLLDTAQLCTAQLEVQKYSKAKNLFRFHSWTPFAFSPDDFMYGDFMNTAVGLTLLSQNNLSSAFTELGYRYNAGFHSAHASLTYRGRFPAFELGGNYGTRYRNEIIIGQGSRHTDDLFGNLHLTTFLPLNLSEGNLHSGFTPYLRLNLNNDRMSYDGGDTYSALFSVGVGTSVRVFTRMAHRDINPRWGTILNVHLLNVPATQKPWQVSTQTAQFFLPGILPNSSIRLYLGREVQSRPLLYNTRLATPRGLIFENGLSHPSLRAFSASYALPLCHPDLTLGFFAYIKRIRVNVFYDRLNALHSDQRTPLTSSTGDSPTTFTGVGYEALFDFHPLRFPAQMSVGWRHSFNSSSMSMNQLKTLPVELLVSFEF